MANKFFNFSAAFFSGVAIVSVAVVSTAVVSVTNVSQVFAQPADATQAPHVCQPENIPSATPTSRFTVNADGTVTDNKTELVWKACAEGLSGEGCTEGEALALNWAEALLYMNEHNKSGDGNWRLANIRELSTLVETRCVNPAINVEVFPGTPPMHVWASSPYHFYTHYSWYVDFGYGTANYDERIRDKGLRLVRDLK